MLNHGTKGTVRVHEVQFDTAMEFLDALAPMGGAFVGGMIFRGQAESTWGLVPAVFREGVPRLLPANYFPFKHRTYGAQVRLEFELLWLFVARANEAGLTIPGDGDAVRAHLDAMRDNGSWQLIPSRLREWPDRLLLPSLALAQHHGVPTRLLDWTYDGFTAAYFAAEGAAREERRDGRLAVWACRLTENRKHVDRVKSIEICRPSNAFNANLQAQRGCLMVWRNGAGRDDLLTETALERVVSAEADRREVQGAELFYKLTLPQTEAGALLQLLSMHRVDGASMFPGFDGVARVVHERQYWDGFVGTGAKPFSGSLNERSKEIRNRVLAGVRVWKPEISDPVTALLSALRATAEAGDYDYSREAKVRLLEEMQQQTGRLSVDVRAEIAELLPKLRLLL